MILKRLSFKQCDLFNKVFLINYRKLCSNNSPVVDHYEVLGLNKNATQAEIKNAYFELSKIYHPDKITATDENLAKFRAISDAYQILGNEQAKRLYDRGLLKGIGKGDISPSDDLSDPIVKFYKERQTRAKETSKAAPLSTEYYKKFKTKTFNENEFYKYTTTDKKEELNYLQTGVFQICLLFCIGVYICSHLENSALQKTIKKLLKSLD